MPRGPKPLRSKLKADEFYCVSCRKRVHSKNDDICVKVYRNRRTNSSVPALKGQCAKCDTNVTKFISHDKIDSMRDKHGKC